MPIHKTTHPSKLLGMVLPSYGWVRPAPGRDNHTHAHTHTDGSEADGSPSPLNPGAYSHRGARPGSSPEPRSAGSPLLGSQDHPALQGVTLVPLSAVKVSCRRMRCGRGPVQGCLAWRAGNRLKSLKQLAGSEDTCAPRGLSLSCRS